MSVLRQPFDQSEYDDLMAMATRRIRITKFKELRNMSIPYSTNALGYSYFDHYPDLARQMECADPHRGLSLLRGFFFWLQNVGHEGAFMPWVAASTSYKSVPYNDCKKTVSHQSSN
ncbi:uncharacterized protein LOC109708289 [Ananas comosus]|nr:uncharacterized protein LOC109708289 [Ananas comosus]CAD1844474.1 unnamed protein product [Ananas comosus var. bracteatus]